MPAEPTPHLHSAAIDVIKGLAIISVIFLHTLSARALSRSGAVFHIGEAVPVFLFLMGLNGAASLRRRGAHTLRECYTPSYFVGRFDRVVVPFLLAFLATVLVVGLTHKAHYAPSGLAGDLFTAQLPISGPGNYFVALIIQFVLVFPAIQWGLQRRPIGVLLLCLAVDITFELAAEHAQFIASHPYAYEACLARYLFLVALGACCSRLPVSRLLHSRLLWCGVLLSVAYEWLLLADPGVVPLGKLGWGSQTFAAAFYPAMLVIVGIRLLPASAHSLGLRCLAGLGRASYHIFLVQIAWFGLVVWRGDSWSVLLGNLLVTLPVGVAFHLAMQWTALPSLGRLLTQRRAAPAGTPQ